MTNTKKPETVTVSEHRVSCDGGGGALGHPKVYMEMGQESSVRCKYCDKVFELKH
ncbi:MAG: zinc-finger domain-containing protein [Robiginitomaculum sp.]|nr:MAG: zinc-finger domain-containing protein [Robiginitomaculum sp.]